MAGKKNTGDYLSPVTTTPAINHLKLNQPIQFKMNIKGIDQ
jgi:hypothetical protein